MLSQSAKNLDTRPNPWTALLTRAFVHTPQPVIPRTPPNNVESACAAATKPSMRPACQLSQCIPVHSGSDQI